ncbi:MAG: YraN family protein [Eubacteriales bacterium]
MQNNREVGTKYEQLVGGYLEEKGYQILTYNYRCKIGEIDIVAKDKEQLVFIEVKYRKNLSMGSPLAAVTHKKQQTISKCAKFYMMCNNCYDMSVRFDVVGIVGQGDNMEMNHLVNAFDYC